jgi:DNA gyrase/topoisomerase IV subunit A
MSTRWNRTPEDYLPDVRDGLTRLDRVILCELSRAQQERDGGHVPSAELYGRVIEHLNVGVPEFERALVRLVRR